MASSTSVALVTGASRRLGRAIALDFGRRGWAVALHVRHVDGDARDIEQEIKGSGGAASLFSADLSIADEASALVAAVSSEFGCPSCLINNASVFAYDDIGSLTARNWDEHFAVNVRAPVLLSKAMYEMLDHSANGNIINVIDQRVWKPTPHFLSYAGSKSALWSMTQTLAQAMAPRVRVNAIGPGPMLRSVHQTVEQFQLQQAATPLRRGTTPEEICTAINFILASPAITGQMIALDGGQHLAWQTPDIGDGRG